MSRRCAELLPTAVMDSALSVARATHRMADDLRTCPVDCSSSGATLVLTIIRGGKVRVPNHSPHQYRIALVGVKFPCGDMCPGLRRWRNVPRMGSYAHLQWYNHAQGQVMQTFGSLLRDDTLGVRCLAQGIGGGQQR